MKVLTTAAPGSPEWLKAREGKIGGTSAVDIICGGDLNYRCFGSPLSVWMRMTGRATKDALEGADDELRRIIRWGAASEPLHREMLAEETGGALEGPPGVLQHDRLEWLAVSPDGRCALPDRGRGSIELKAPSRFTVHEWQEGAPLPYQVQAAAVMCVEETPYCIVSALIPPRVSYAIIERDPVFEQFMLDQLGAFMRLVETDTPPPATFRPIDKALLYKLHPKDNGATVILPAEIELEFAALREEQKALAALEARVEGRKARIAQSIGANTEGRVGPFSATYKHQTRTVSCKSCGAIASHSEFRVLRPKFA